MRNQNRDVIAARAAEHKRKFSSFDIERFLQWVDTKTDNWLLWASRQPTTRLSRTFKFERSLMRLAERSN